MIKRLQPILLLALAACTAAPQGVSTPAPRSVAAVSSQNTASEAPPPEAGRRAVGKQGAVTSANALASEAGLAVLRAGGNAVDGAVATAFAIGVVEPHMSGLGGGGAALVWLKDKDRPEFLDFYPAQYIPSFEGHLERSGRGPDMRIVGIPGNVAGLLELHEKYGVLPLAQVMAPAIELAEKGYPVGQILSDMIADSEKKLSRFAASKRRYLRDGEALKPGEIIRNPELAATLRLIVEKGRDGFYKGRVAEAMVKAMNAGGHPVTLEHLANYQTTERRPLCIDYRGRAVLSAPPPQSGLRVLHTLELLEPYDLKTVGLPTRSGKAFDLLASALRVGSASSRYVTDPAWSAVPAAGVISEPFAKSRANLVGTGRAAESIPRPNAQRYDNSPPAGDCARYEPYGPAAPISAIDAEEAVLALGAEGGLDLIEEDQGGETTHLSVVDRHGNAVALTQTNSAVFGIGAEVEGFILNNSGVRVTERMLRAKSRSPWRTRATTISPTIILEDGMPKVVVGAPGGGRIPTAVVQTIIYALDYEMDALDAVRMPRIFPSSRNTRVEVEHGFSPEALAEARSMGYDPVNPTPGYARLYLITRQGDNWVAAADPRHDGEARAF